jgi:YD repeat-containing protein
MSVGARRVQVTNGKNQPHIEVRNGLGETIAAYDLDCGKVEYDYDAVGNLVWVKGADDAEITTHYDLAGRKDWMNDPDKGNWTYQYNALGELVEQTDAKGQIIEFEYDLLGRITTRWEYNAQGSLVNREEANWNTSTTSDPGAPDYVGKGEIESEVYYEANTANVVHQRTYDYDGFGRVISASTSMDGLLLTEETTYDQFGRVFQQFDASGDNHGLRYVYNDQCYLAILKEAREGAGGKEYQTVLSMDARGNVTQMALGSGVT